jgi:KaiC/GvpD/RAD55 family RecA-like ATPase
MQDMEAAGEPIEPVRVSNRLREKGQLDKVGGNIFLSGLSEQVGTAAYARHYAKLVLEKATRRRIQDHGRELTHKAWDNGITLSDLLTYVQSQANDLSAMNGNWIPIMSANKLLARDFQKEDEIIGGGILPAGGGLLLAGESGAGKSLIRTELAIHLVMGWDFLGMEIPKARQVLVIQFENTLRTEQYRLKQMLTGMGISNFPDALSFSKPDMRLDLKTQRDRRTALEIVRAANVDVIIWDPLTSLHSVNENDNVLIRNVLDSITEINRKADVTSILIHHFGKPHEGQDNAHRTRGASSIRDWADTLITITRKPHEQRTLRKLDFIKVRNGPEPKPLLLKRDDDYFIHTVAEEDVLCPPTKVAQILERLGGRVEGKMNLKEAIMEEVKCGEKTARNAIGLAIERGMVQETSHPAKASKKVYEIVVNGVQ